MSDTWAGVMGTFLTNTIFPMNHNCGGWQKVPVERKLPPTCSPVRLFSASFPSQDRRGIAYNDEHAGEYRLDHDALQNMLKRLLLSSVTVNNGCRS